MALLLPAQLFGRLADPILLAAAWTGTGALALTLVIGLYIIVLRDDLRRRRRQEQRVIAVWRPLLNAALAGEPPASLPALAAADRLTFLKLWVRLHQSVRGDASSGLNQVGAALHCGAIARSLLNSGQRARKLLGILALGHLRDRSAWDSLAREAAGEDAATSVHALWALVQIDPAAAAREMAPLLLRRDDWALSQVAKILHDAHAHWTPVLVAAIPQLPQERLPSALRLLEGLRATLPAQVLQGLLRGGSVDVLIAVLRMAAVPDMLDLVRSHISHEDWRVRLQAARALGHIGDASDVPRLQGMLCDSQWWVRYRAAQALASLPFLTQADIQAVCEGADRFGADMMRQVLAEAQLAT
ncbi:hypothetical protein GCM10027277_23320 [Pseudoduganella ginsengisoli]|uniref:HEAT repeat domain-containing protein n=1 Tax=Pseudoduganella ginsengisoli TaxID=1462440 RepID=A0A6L6Q865_9BURK|nr:HEAT repeat domain-containing protein [Pseudoduganella ginsengisoli]MTW05408.1 HEAT repeat domain-containing protein [Pseudoduganella ginsengisoli]